MKLMSPFWATVRPAFVCLVVAFACAFANTALAQSPISGVTKVVSGLSHACAISSGGVKCWGANGNGQLGDGSTTRRLMAVDASGLGSGVVALAAGFSHTCALTTAGSVKCWGGNSYGQLGDGTTTNRLTPVDVTGLGSGIVALTAGDSYSCALTTAGTVKCWGYNLFGQLGDNSTVNRNVPVDVAGLTNIAAISSGGYHACALTTAGSVKCWGNNGSGQLGDASNTNRLTPVDVNGLTGGTGIYLGSGHSCVVRTGGGVKCWGGNSSGQLGDGSLISRTSPVDVPGVSGVTAMAAGIYHTCILADGGVQCWGNNTLGQLGNGSSTASLTPVAVGGLTSGVSAISSGGTFTCAAVNGGVRCWGSDAHGQLGGNYAIVKLAPVAVSGLSSGVVKLAIGNHGCVVTSAGGVKCWGSNPQGQIGDTTQIDRFAPVDVSGLTSGVAEVSAGASHSCALTTGGGVKCWGANFNGQLGDATTTDRYAPVDVSGLTSGVTAISVGGGHACALTTGGGVKCWGYGWTGQLGANIFSSSTPVDVSGLTSGVVAISAGSGHTCALTSLGGIKCWGTNADGQLGDNTTTNRFAPMDVSGLTTGVVAISAGGSHTCALTSGGAVKCWGNNGFGQMGDGTTTGRLTAVDVSGLNSGVTKIAGGWLHTCAIASGALKCWGNNSSGELGDTTYTQRLVPVDVSGLNSGVVSVGASFRLTCALVTGGAVKCWGDGTFGAIGDGVATVGGSLGFGNGAGFPLPVTALAVNTVPGVPTGVVGNATDGAVTVSWSAPANNGGIAITGYVVQVGDSSGIYSNAAGTCAPTNTNVSPSTSCTATGLVNGTTYYFKIAAINAVGMGIYSSVSAGALPISLAPPPPSIATLPVLAPGVSPLPTIANLSSGEGAAFVAAMTTMLNTALGANMQFVEQSTHGTLILRGFQGGNLAFVPYGFQSGDFRPNGVYPAGDGRYQVVYNGTSLTIVPALVQIDQLVALLPGIQVTQSENGVLVASYGGAVYVVQPSILVQNGQATGTARLVVGDDGNLHFIDAQGKDQTLYPALREPSSLRAALTQIDPNASMAINLDGTVTVQLQGRSWVLLPDLLLQPIPADRVGQAWWQETANRFRYVNNQLQPVSGLSQGLGLR